jgi:hypothetical protein
MLLRIMQSQTSALAVTSPLAPLAQEVIPPPSTKLKGKERFTREQISFALQRFCGVILGAAEWLQETYKVPCSSSYLRNLVRNDPAYQEIQDNARQDWVDHCQLEYLDATTVQSDKAPPSPARLRAYEFVLTTVGKDRGFGRRVEHTGKDGTPIEVKISAEDAKMV